MRKLVYFLIVGFFLISMVSASLEINIDVKPKFFIGERMSFDYSIRSSNDVDILYSPKIICESVSIPILETLTESLSGSVLVSQTFEGQIIDGTVESQNCVAYVDILSPISQRAERNFTIDTFPSFSFNLKFDKSVFVKGEEINLDYVSEVGELLVTAILEYPSGESQDIQVPTTLNLDEIGTYTINARASKEGYKTVQVSRQIGIIEKYVDIVTTAPNSAIRVEEESNFWIWLLIVGLIILLVIFSIFYKKMKKNSLN